MRIFFGAAVASREGLRPWIHAIAREQFDEAKDQDVKVEALNLLGLVVSPHDLDRLLEHVTGSPPDLYDGCRPLSELPRTCRNAAVLFGKTDGTASMRAAHGSRRSSPSSTAPSAGQGAQGIGLARQERKVDIDLFGCGHQPAGGNQQEAQEALAKLR